jgi:hypothetical protein
VYPWLENPIVVSSIASDRVDFLDQGARALTIPSKAVRVGYRCES